MRVAWNSNRKECTLLIKVRTRKPEKIVLQVRDARKPHTFYTNRWNVVNGKAIFFVRLPQSPDLAIINIFNKANGNRPKGEDNTFKVAKPQIVKLKRKFPVFRSPNKSLLNFIRFAQQFSENAGLISGEGSVYLSDDGRFRVVYFDVIRNSKGKAIRTPARINRQTGEIQVAKKFFKEYTVPMRMALLLHEYSHFYINYTKSDETEADLNALLIYLSLGYPRIEAHQAFLKVFKGTPTDGNKERYEKVRTFIDNFENAKMKMVV